VLGSQERGGSCRGLAQGDIALGPPWLRNNDILLAWLDSIDDKYRTVNGAALDDAGARGFYDMAALTKDERISSAPWGGLPMVTEPGEGGANAGGLRFAIGQNQDLSFQIGLCW